MEIESFCSSGAQRCMDSRILLVQSSSEAKPKIMVGIFLLEAIFSVKIFFLNIHF